MFRRLLFAVCARSVEEFSSFISFICVKFSSMFPLVSGNEFESRGRYHWKNNLRSICGWVMESFLPLRRSGKCSADTCVDNQHNNTAEQHRIACRRFVFFNQYSIGISPCSPTHVQSSCQHTYSIVGSAHIPASHSLEHRNTQKHNLSTISSG